MTPSNQLLPLTSITRIRGASSSTVPLDFYFASDWDTLEISLWVWVGDINPTSRGEEYKFVIQNFTKTPNSRIDIKPYLMEKMKIPLISGTPSDYDTFTMDCSVWFTYLYQYKYNGTIVGGIYDNTSQQYNNMLRAATLGTELRNNHSLSRINITNNYGNITDPWLSSNQIIQRFEYPTDILAKWYIDITATQSDNLVLFSSMPVTLGCTLGYGIGYINKFGLYTQMPVGTKVQGTLDKTADKYMHSNLNSRYSLATNEIGGGGDYSETNIQYSMKWYVNTPYFTSEEYNFYEDILYAPYIWLINFKSDTAIRVRLTGSNILKSKRYDRQLMFEFNFEELNKII